jgi:hypothetical protein
MGGYRAYGRRQWNARNRRIATVADHGRERRKWAGKRALPLTRPRPKHAFPFSGARRPSTQDGNCRARKPSLTGLLCNLCQEPLCLGDLGHFRRRCEAFERWSKSGVRVGEAGGRLIKLGERQRRLQTEAAGALLSSDC